MTNQIKLDSIAWKRNKSIEIIERVMIKCNEIDVKLIESPSFNKWYKDIHCNLLPYVMIYLGYKTWAELQDLFIEVYNVAVTTTKLRLSELKIKKELTDTELSEEFSESLRIEKNDKAGSRLISHVSDIETLMTEVLRNNFEEFKDLDYRKTPKHYDK
ncbi:MAG: hypothetical protein HOG05_13145 [Bacteroidetes bacterium]|nr:hypothetical protein [Bacteroidota bacterium]